MTYRLLSNQWLAAINSDGNLLFLRTNNPSDVRQGFRFDFTHDELLALNLDGENPRNLQVLEMTEILVVANRTAYLEFTNQ